MQTVTKTGSMASAGLTSAGCVSAAAPTCPLLRPCLPRTTFRCHSISPPSCSIPTLSHRRSPHTSLSCPLPVPHLSPFARSQTVSRTRLHAGGESDNPVEYSKQFGYSRKDVILIGVGFLALGFGLNYGLQAAGVSDTQAGLYTQLIIVLLLSVGWVSTYLFRVATKQMTYTQQLQAYEQAVMKARLKEMTEEEVENLMATIEAEKQTRSEPPK